MTQRRPVMDRLMEKVCPEPNSGCWLWTGTLDGTGYGRLRDGESIYRQAHRLAYEAHRGAIPEGTELDHLCRVRCCVNPDHLEAVSHHENLRRAGMWERKASRTHCPHGHPFSGDNLYFDAKRNRRICIACRRASIRKYMKTYRARPALAAE